MLSRMGLLLCAAGCLLAPAKGFAQNEVCDEACYSNGANCDSNGNCNGSSRWNLCDRLDEHYAQYADLPIGSRQKYKFGKLWGPTPRPTDPNAKIIHRYHYAHYWPHPYDCADRAAVRSLISMHESKGWANATTLYDYHFDPESQELTDAGALQLRTIMMDAPSQYRRAFVQTSYVAGANEVRMASVQDAVARLSGGVGNLPVELRNTTPTGRPANEIEFMNKKVLDTMPAPRIQYGNSSGYGITQGR